MTLAGDAIRYLRAGLSVIPIDHRTKRPRGEWKEFQSRRPEERELKTWFGAGVKALAMICGHVSGGLLVFDFDVPEFFEEWARATSDLAHDLPCQRTGGGGYQVFLRCPDPGGNQKLAWSPKESEQSGREVAIETRGEGGYVVAPPSLHPSGGVYRWENVTGDLVVPEVSQTVADALIGAARKLDRMPYPRQELEAQEAKLKAAGERKRGGPHEEKSVIDAYNKKYTIEETLERYGYHRGYGGRYIRPGGSSPSVQVSDGRSFHHSSNDPLCGPHLVDPFEVYCRFDHGGDVKSAVKSAAAHLGFDRKGGRKKGASNDVKDAPPPSGELQKISDDDDHLNFTDTGNAKRLARRWGHMLRYNKEPYGKWLWWTGRYWKFDGTNKIYEYVDRVVAELYREAADEEDAQRRKAIGACARGLESMSKQKALVAKAETLQHLVVASEDLDDHPYLFNAKNMTLDLSDGALKARAHCQEDYLTRTAEVEYDPEARCPRWERFLEEIFDGDHDVIQFVQRAVGYSLTGDISEQCLFFAYGTGKNGKSVFFNTIEILFVDYFYKAPAEMILQQKYSQIPSDVAQLKGKRFVVSSELEENRRLAESRVKNLTGGDTIEARPMYKEWFTFKPTHKLWIYGNHKPVITGTDEGIWRRIRVIPFTVTIAEERRLPMRELLDSFRAELSGILNWALEGYLRYREVGFNSPSRMSRTTDEYRTEMDIIGQFLEECCDSLPSLDIKAKSLWQAYHGWCEEQGEHTMTSRRFNSQLRERGYEVNIGSGNKTYIHGLALKMNVVDG